MMRWHSCRSAGFWGAGFRWCRSAQPPATGWHPAGMTRRRNRQVAATGGDEDEDDGDLQARGDVRGWRGAGPTLRGRKMGSGPDFDMMGAAHSNPG